MGGALDAVDVGGAVAAWARVAEVLAAQLGNPASRAIITTATTRVAAAAGRTKRSIRVFSPPLNPVQDTELSHRGKGASPRGRPGGPRPSPRTGSGRARGHSPGRQRREPWPRSARRP